MAIDKDAVWTTRLRYAEQSAQFAIEAERHRDLAARSEDIAEQADLLHAAADYDRQALHADKLAVQNEQLLGITRLQPDPAHKNKFQKLLEEGRQLSRQARERGSDDGRER